jgi:dienelactone hydrolase
VIGAAAAAAVSLALRPPVEGPFGRGAAAVWVLRPRGVPRAVVVFGHGWKTAPPSPSHPWVGQFRPWLDHLVGEGDAVLFPRYQLGFGDSVDAARFRDYVAGVRTGLARLGRPHVPLVAAGYSFGASLALTLAADAPRLGLAVPAAVDAVFPAGPIVGAPLPRLRAPVRVLIQVGDADLEAGPAGAALFRSWLAHHTQTTYQVVRSRPGFRADHAAPKRADLPAREAFWAPLDRLLRRHP